MNIDSAKQIKYEFIEVPANKISLSKRRKCHGVGINDSAYITQMRVNGNYTICPYYRKWIDMLNRCYSKKFHLKNATYIGCTVCDEWLSFLSFKQWMSTQDWKGNDLDKDLLVQGNKIYSPGTCLFVSPRVNRIIGSKIKRKENIKKGASYIEKLGKFSSSYYLNGKSHYLGLFNSEDEAHEEYKKVKYRIIYLVAMEQKEPIKSALLKYNVGENV
tara:strand:+ start:108 stop:755 length:648 start_codon:yes stop_codon:yes gene_type:complete